MKKELEDLKGKNPFSVPEDYFEGFTARMMSRLPEKTYEPPKKVTTFERVRPWLYMAAIFVGLGLFFKAIVGTDPAATTPDQLSSNTIAAIQADENADYLEYLETQYANYILEEELGDFE